MSKIIIMADTHIGNNRWPVSRDRFNAPLEEFIQYAQVHEVDMAIVAGDLFHRRNPSTQDVFEANKFILNLQSSDATVRVVAGNHDTFATPGSPSALWYLAGDVGMQTEVVAEEVMSPLDDANIVYLPWLHYRYWTAEGSDRPIDDLLHEAEQQVYESLEHTLKDLRRENDWPNILVGHAHVYYGDSFDPEHTPDSPRLLAGRDVLLSYKWLTERFDLVALGHIHDASAKGYVGSTQPTDFADVGPKGFWRVDVPAREEPPNVIPVKPGVTFVPFESYLRVKHWQVRAETVSDLRSIVVPEQGSRAYPVDIGRLTVQLIGNPTLTIAQAQDWLAGIAEIPHGVSLLPPTRERRIAALGAADVGDLSSIPDALGVWLQSKELGEQIEPVMQELAALRCEG